MPSVVQGHLTYGAVKDIRTSIGSQLDRGVFQTDVPTGELKALYAALSADMTRGAAAVGPDAAKAVRFANERYGEISRQRELIDDVLKRAGGIGGPENLWNALMNSGKERGWGGGATLIHNVMGMLDEPTRQYLSASALQRMGMATAGKQGVEREVFSADTFLTNWNRMSDAARQEMFGGIPGGYSQQITQLARNVETLKRYAGILPNTSNTAQVAVYAGGATLGLQALLTGNFKEAAGIAGTIASTHALSLALTNPDTVRWMVGQTSKLIEVADIMVRAQAGTRYQDSLPEVTVSARRPNLSDMQSQFP
jgi:hypothetical protein